MLRFIIHFSMGLVAGFLIAYVLLYGRELANYRKLWKILEERRKEC